MTLFLLLVLCCMPIYSPGAAMLILGLMAAVSIGLDMLTALVVAVGIGAVLWSVKSEAKAR